MQDTARKRSKGLASIIFSLLLIFNPNIIIIDILPDFIAYLILAKVFLRAADTAPYFDEARGAFLKLALLNFAKIPTMFLVSSIRAQNARDNDVIALATLLFAVFECVLMIIAIRNIFDALFRLGERTELSSAISDFPISRRRRMSPESLKKLCYAFACVKCFTYFYPNVYLLTRTLPNGAEVHISPEYPLALVLCILVSLIFGIIWLSRIIKYVKAIYRDGGFSDALDRIEASDPSSDCKTRIRARGMRLSLNLLTVMSVLSIDLSFAQTYEVNLVPHFLLGAVMIFVYARLIKLSGVTKRHLLFPVLYTAASAVTFYFQTDFLLKYGYEALLRNEAAREAYPTVELFAAIEFALLIAAFASLYVILKRFILDNTGVSPTSDKYGRIDKDYHTSLLTKTALLSVFGVLSGAAQLASVIANGAIKVVYTDPDDVTMPVIIAPSIAWIGLLVTAMAIAYIGYTVYYVSTMKDELSLNSSRY